MPLNRFGEHGSTSIDKFGKHVHHHVIQNHIARSEVLQPSSTFILTLRGDGDVDPKTKLYKITNKSGITDYINSFYEGMIKDVVKSAHVQLLVNDIVIKSLQGVQLKRGDTIKCKNNAPIGGLPFLVELLIEGVVE